ncbi:hypothetical protein [Sinorhizobium meliloti]|uniref:hypothetical protein n=1 Tax=Rhizobium meliloti TaxID=382 RepID=UPI0030B66265
MIPNIVETLLAAKDKLQSLMTAEDEAAAKRKREWEEEWERYERREDARKAAQAVTDSRQQLAEIIDTWGKAMTVERFRGCASAAAEYGSRASTAPDRAADAREDNDVKPGSAGFHRKLAGP